MFAQQHEFEIVDLRQSEAFVAVGEGLDFSGALDRKSVV